jgi:Cu/Ag efflux pump CusA
MRWVVGTSLKARAIVVALAAAVIFVGVVQVRRAPRDVLPEFTEPTVEVQTEALGLSAPEVEQLVTVPLEQDLLNGTPYVDKIRSQSVPGLSSIQLVFKHGTKLARARQVVNERLTQAAGLPNVSKPPQMLQPLSSTGRVMLVGLSSKTVSLIDMGVLARWTIRPRLMGVPGVANVSIFGQRERQLQVQVDPNELAVRGITLEQVISTTGNALWWSPLGRLEANSPGTGGFIDGPNQRLGIFHQSPIKTPQDLAKVSLESNGTDRTPPTAVPSAAPEPAAPGEQLLPPTPPTPAAPPLRLGDVATVVDNNQPMIGDGVVGGRPGLLLVIQKFPDANVVDVTRRVEKALAALAPGLAGVQIDRSLFRPAGYVQTSTDNLMVAFVVGAALLALLVLALLLAWRIALISAVTVLVSLSAAGLVLRLRGETINAMVLAGLALALVVLADDVIADTENIQRRLRSQQQQPNGGTSRAQIVFHAALETRRPLGYGTVVILLGLLPVVVLKGEVGAFLPPLALSYGVAIVASMLVALTLTPVLSSLLLASDVAVQREPPLVRLLHRGYDRVFPRVLRASGRAFVVLGIVALAGVVSVPFLGRGRSLVPTFRDTNLLVQFNGAPGTSLTEMDRITARASGELRRLPGVRGVGAQVGRAVLADRVVGVDSSELWVTLDPSADYDRTLASIRSVVDGYPGLTHAVLTYPAARINEVLHKKTHDLTVRLYGPDPTVLREKANEVRNALAKVAGISKPRVQLPAMEPTFQVEVDLAKAQRVGIKPGDVRRAAATLLSGLGVGALFEDQKVFDVVVWGTPKTRANVSSVRDLLIDSPAGDTVRLGDVANVRLASTQAVIKHEDVSRFVDIGAAVHGRDVSAVAGDVRQRLKQITFPLEHHAQVLNDYARHRSEFLRFLEVSIAAAIGIFLLLQAVSGSWRVATLAFVALPASLAGGLVAALANGGTISLGSLAGFFVIFAVAARQLVVLVNRYSELAESEEGSLDDIVSRATRERVVPIIVTTLGAVALLLPLLLFGHTAGYELVHPMTVVVLGGLFTAASVNLLVVPPLYARFGPTPEHHAPFDIAAPVLETANGNGRVDVVRAGATDA